MRSESAHRPLPFLLAGLLVAPAAEAQTIRVPADASLEQALRSVADGGVIEIGAGVYPSPPGGFRVGNLVKGFTVRSAPGAEVVLDGGGVEPVLVLQVEEGKPRRRVSLESLIFRSGAVDASNRAAGLTLSGADGDVVGCRFEGNRGGPSAGAGGILVRRGGHLRVTSSRFEGNSSGLRGGALSATDAVVEIVGSRFLDNRVNRAGHRPGAVGGAVHLLDTTATVLRSTFEGNEAAWVGGALYAFGRFRDGGTEPATTVVVDDGTFLANRAAPHACCGAAGVPGGGAIHVEDSTSLVVRNSRFRDNSATWGGAVTGFRALLEIEDSELVGNRLDVPDDAVKAGGVVNVTSADNGALRGVSSLVLRRTFVRGGNDLAEQGGCIFASGASGELAPVRLEEVVLEDCRAVTTSRSPGLGGALFLNRVDLVVERSLVLEGKATGASAGGGGLFALGGSSVRLLDSSFVGNRSDDFGGALLVDGGGELEVRRSTFVANEADAAVRGSVLAAILGPRATSDLVGVIADSLFAGNVGVELLELDNTAGPVNRLSYDGNRFVVSTAGQGVLRNSVLGPSLHGVAELNGLVVPHAGGAVDKSEVANVQLFSPPSTARLLAVPSRLPLAASGAGEPPRTFVAYAWTGPGARLNGAALERPAGVVETDEARAFRLEVSGAAAADAAVERLPCSRGPVLCLDGDRFLVQVDWRDAEGRTGAGRVVPGGSRDSGLFWFFDRDNWELLVKVLDGCGQNGHYWVFSAVTTDVEYDLRVTDTRSGRSSRYRKRLGTPAAAIADTGALAVCDAQATGGPAARRPGSSAPARSVTATSGGCPEGDTGICLGASRFLVEVDWRDFEDRRGSGRVAPLRSDDSGLFWFFDANNWEMLVKVLDGCSFNGRFWVFAAATTNLEVELRVTDTATGEVREYFNPLGTEAAAVADTGAFATCP